MISLTIKIHLETLVVDPAPIQYDVFLSYSHRDDKQANYIVKLLQKLHPKLRLFFDIQELKTGREDFKGNLKQRCKGIYLLYSIYRIKIRIRVKVKIRVRLRNRFKD